MQKRKLRHRELENTQVVSGKATILTQICQILKSFTELLSCGQKQCWKVIKYVKGALNPGQISESDMILMRLRYKVISLNKNV